MWLRCYASREGQSRSLDIETRDLDSYHNKHRTLKESRCGDICSNASDIFFDSDFCLFYIFTKDVFFFSCPIETQMTLQDTVTLQDRAAKTKTKTNKNRNKNKGLLLKYRMLS